MKQSNQKGFSVIELLVILVVVVFVAGAAYFVGHRSKDNPPAQSTTAQTDAKAKSTPGDPTANWKTFEDKRSGVSFKYPSDWNVQIEKNDAFPSDSKGDFLTGTITSPSGKVQLAYTNVIAGLGGGSCPEAFPCPTVHILSIEAVPGLKDPASRYVSKITDWKGNGDGFTVSFGLKQLSDDDPLSIGSSQRNDIYLTNNFTNDGAYFAYHFSPNSSPEAGYKTYAEAQAFLDSDEAKVAKQIILTTTKN